MKSKLLFLLASFSFFSATTFAAEKWLFTCVSVVDGKPLMGGDGFGIYQSNGNHYLTRYNRTVNPPVTKGTHLIRNISFNTDRTAVKAHDKFGVNVFTFTTDVNNKQGKNGWVQIFQRGNPQFSTNGVVDLFCTQP